MTAPALIYVCPACGKPTGDHELPHLKYGARLFYDQQAKTWHAMIGKPLYDGFGDFVLGVGWSPAQALAAFDEAWVNTGRRSTVDKTGTVIKETPP